MSSTALLISNSHPPTLPARHFRFGPFSNLNAHVPNNSLCRDPGMLTHSLSMPSVLVNRHTPAANVMCSLGPATGLLRVEYILHWILASTIEIASGSLPGFASSFSRNLNRAQFRRSATPSRWKRHCCAQRPGGSDFRCMAVFRPAKH